MFKQIKFSLELITLNYTLPFGIVFLYLSMMMHVELSNKMLGHILASIGGFILGYTAYMIYRQIKVVHFNYTNNINVDKMVVRRSYMLETKITHYIALMTVIFSKIYITDKYITIVSGVLTVILFIQYFVLIGKTDNSSGVNILFNEIERSRLDPMCDIIFQCKSADLKSITEHLDKLKEEAENEQNGDKEET